VPIDEIRRRYADAAKTDSAGYAPGIGQGRAATWAGTGELRDSSRRTPGADNADVL